MMGISGVAAKLRIINIVFRRVGYIAFCLINNSVTYERKIVIDIL